MSQDFQRDFSVDQRASFEGSGGNWRRVPKVNLLPRGKSRAVPLATFGLLTVFLVEMLVLSMSSRDLLDVRGRVEDLAPRTIAAEAELSTSEAALQQLYRDVGEAERQSPGGPRNGVVTEWGTSLAALFGAQVQGIEFESVVASVADGVEVIGIAADSDAFGRLQKHVDAVAGLLELEGFTLMQSGESLEFTVTVRLKQ